MRVLLLVLLYGDFLMESSFGFSLGPPVGACVSMFPIHGADAQSSESPFTIIVNKNTYSPGEEITVFVNTTDNNPDIEFFEGLIIQARRARCDVVNYEEALGTFVLGSSEDFLGLMDCQGGANSSVVHKAHAHIYNRTFTWIAPSTRVGHIYFRGTIARRQSTFWTNVKSSFIRDTTDASTPVTCFHQSKQAIVSEECSTDSASGMGISFLLLAISAFYWVS
ncbi:putative defense protein 3 [Argopecten irradians]|uniref:putative defense protein 3 n=1 Tax=Argopecten irradians TaxID=31199 RepID=UPI0037117D38